jgi:exosortase/archaeosortase family protein
MRPKRKKTASSARRHIYSTREIMDITEQRRQKENPAQKEAELKPAPVTEDLSPPLTVPAKEENTEAIKGEDRIPANSIAGIVILILSLIAFFLIVSSKHSEPWVNPVVAQLNALIIYGSYIVLNILQGASTAQGPILNTYYYKVSLQGDLVALYSLALLIGFAALFIFFKKTARIKWGKILMALVPLAVVANIFRVVMAFGLALNNAPALADRSFHGVLVGVVFLIIVLGLMLFEYLSSSD